MAQEPGETLFLYLAASAEAVNMVLVAERTGQTCQGDTGVPPAEDDGLTIMESVGDPEPRGPDEPRPNEEPEALGAEGPAAPKPDVVKKGELGSY